MYSSGSQPGSWDPKKSEGSNSKKENTYFCCTKYSVFFLWLLTSLYACKKKTLKMKNSVKEKSIFGWTADNSCTHWSQSLWWRFRLCLISRGHMPERVWTFDLQHHRDLFPCSTFFSLSCWKIAKCIEFQKSNKTPSCLFSWSLSGKFQYCNSAFMRLYNFLPWMCPLGCQVWFPESASPGAESAA